MTFLVSNIHAQKYSHKKKKATEYISSKNEYGGQIQMIAYRGDINSRQLISTHFNPGMNIFYRRNISKIINMRFSAGIGSMEAKSDKNYKYLQPIGRPKSNTSPFFKKKIFDFKYLLEYHFLDFRNKKTNQKYSPYLVGGFGLGIIDGNQSLYIPLGAGIKFALGKRINIEFELVSNKTFTDLLDDVDSNEDFSQGYFGSDVNFDTFLQFSMGISYRIISLNCPSHLSQAIFH